MEKKLPHICPSCSSELNVQSLVCSNCATLVSGEFGLPLLARFTPEEQAFIIDFVKSSGSLKVMAQKLNLSYPSVRNLLDDLIVKIENNEKPSNPSK
ncbi:DUF2089 family protein [Mucilaginibacter arboris]|uniref:DUF2089 family protein n=1 Tax=Mucilaginibacter arboris TaxID=2682090 RepID=A0A7K1SUC9_9SPHI|nr:DUF2089 family protein [Mucilaginibacter arboris]MVN20848.1 DUF2089 family protein [Mucilaginibacter arboris]